jgi:hypothetical protein
MNLRKALLVASVPVLALAATGPAQARGGWGFGLGLGVGLLATAPYWAPRPYYPYYAPAYYGPAYAPAYYSYPAYGYGPYYSYAPSRYVERAYIEAPTQAAPAVGAFSYFYCPSSNGYYPYTRECAGGWQRISASPVGI